MTKYFYKIGGHVLMSNHEAASAIPSRTTSDDFAFVQFPDGVSVHVIKDGDCFGA